MFKKGNSGSATGVTGFSNEGGNIVADSLTVEGTVFEASVF